MTFDDAIARLDQAGLWGEMLAFVEMEPLPAGALLIETAEIADPGARHLGGDSSGGAWLELSDGRIALASSEGEIGVIGASLAQALAHGIGVGGLYDALRFMGAADLAGARAGWLAFRAQWNMPVAPAGDPAAEEIVALLDLTLPEDAFAGLYHAVQGTPPDLVRMGGEPFRLFGAPLAP